MNLKKIFAAFAATVVAAAMAISASADVAFPMDQIKDGDANFTCWILGESEDGTQTGILNVDPDAAAKITAIKWTIDCPDAANPETWHGGAYGLNTKTGGWDAPQWCVNEETDAKTIATKIDDTTYEVVREVKFDPSEEYIQIVFQTYSSATLKSVTLVGLDEIPTASGNSSTTSTTSSTTSSKTTSTPKTGATSGLALAGLALAGAAIVATKKSK